MYKVERLKLGTNVIANSKDCAMMFAWEFFLNDVEELSMSFVEVKRNWVSLISSGEIPGYVKISLVEDPDQ